MTVQQLKRLCIHTITTRSWDLPAAVKKYPERGIGGISVWRKWLEGRSLNDSANILQTSGLKVVSLVRGGFFASPDKKERESAIIQNLTAIDEAHAIRADMVVLVCGASPGQALSVSLDQIFEGITSILPYASEKKIKLAVEPLHPMYTDTKSVINTLNLANNVVEKFNSEWLGVAVDVYHTWWDPNLLMEIRRAAGNKNLLAVHLCDWRVPTRDMLNDREIMGYGIINIQEVIDTCEKAGYTGMYEVEIFSDEYWKSDTAEFLDKIIHAWLKYRI